MFAWIWQVAAEAPANPWISVGTLLAAAGALMGVGAMKEKVRSHGERLNDHDEALKNRVTKTEFEMCLDRIEAMHEDVREIRKRLP